MDLKHCKHAGYVEEAEDGSYTAKVSDAPSSTFATLEDAMNDVELLCEVSGLCLSESGTRQKGLPSVFQADFQGERTSHRPRGRY